MYSTSTSATRAQASSSPAACGTHHRRPARSSSSQVASTGTAVPTWSGDRISTWVPTPSWGESSSPPASVAF